MGLDQWSNARPAPSKDGILRQLDLIQDRRSFKASKRLRRTLEFLVKETLAGRQSALHQKQIARAVFQRGEDFDPTIDAIVRVELGKLRYALREYYAGAGENDPVVIDIPKGQYVPTFSRSRVTHAESNGTPYKQRVGLAILPFSFYRRDDPDWLAAGLQNDLELVLCQFSAIRVSARHDVDSAMLGDVDRDSIAAVLGVRFVLDGSLRRVGEQVRVWAELYDADARRALWSGRFEIDLSDPDILAVLDAIVGQVTTLAIDPISGALGRQLRKESNSLQTCDLRTYEALARFYQYLHEMSDASLTQATESLHVAHANDPNNATLLAALGDVTRAGYVFGVSSQDPMQRVLEIHSRAITLAPSSAAVQISYGYSLLVAKQMDALGELIENLLKEPALPDTHRADACVLLALAGRWERGCDGLKTLIGGGYGFPPYFRYPLLFNAYRNGQFEDCLAASDMTPPTAFFWYPLLRSACMGQIGLLDEARQEWNKVLSIRSDFPERHGHYLSCILADADFVAHLTDGLRKGGARLQ